MLRLVIFCSVLLGLPVWAKGLSPYLPLNQSPEIEAEIEKVMALTDGAPLTKPYKAYDLMQRSRALKDTYPLLYQRISAYLTRYTQQIGRTHLGASLALSDDENKALPNQRNIKADSAYQVSIGGFGFLNPYIYASTGLIWSDSEGVTQTNSHIGFGYEYAQVELGYREHWFSPFQDSAMLVSTHAKASPSITISNAQPITDWNIRYEVFYSKLEETQGIRLGDELSDGRPSHAGLHLSFTPFDFWTLGINRTLQFGGGARDVGFKDVLEALFDPAGKDNVGDYEGDDPNYEFGNQQASVTSKWNFNWGMPISFYMESGGEDTQGEKNYRLGNETLSAGLFLPILTENLSLRYEFNRWSTAWYVHHLYRNGYTNDGQVMGHWGGGERQFNDDVPAHVHSLNLNWNMAEGQLLNGTLRSIENKPSVKANYQRGIELDLRYSYATQYGFIGVNAYLGKSTLGQSFNRISIFYRW